MLIGVFLFAKILLNFRCPLLTVADCFHYFCICLLSALHPPLSALYMKNFGSTVEFTRQRNADIMRVFRRIFAGSRGVSLPEIYRQVAESPSSRFWVSEERAAIVIASIQAGRKLPAMTLNKREMFDEIYRRYSILRALYPQRSIIDLASEIVHQPAPKFYFTPRSVGEFIYRIRNGYYDTPSNCRHS